MIEVLRKSIYFRPFAGFGVAPSGHPFASAILIVGSRDGLDGGSVGLGPYPSSVEIVAELLWLNCDATQSESTDNSCRHSASNYSFHLRSSEMKCPHRLCSS